MTLHVWTFDSTDTVVAESEEDAWAVWTETMREKREDYSDCKWVQRPDDQPLTIIDTDDEPQTEETKTCAEWAADGRRFLCSTEY